MKRRLVAYGLVFAAALVLLQACAIETVSRPPPPDPKTQMAALESRVVELVDRERQKLAPTAKPLRLDSELVGVARKKSADMAARNYLAHAAPDGQTTATIIMDEDAKFQGLLGENIAAQHYTKEGGVDVDAFAKAFVDTWLKSPQHRDNLVFGPYDRTGVGAAVNGDTVYVTQLFATDMGLPPPPDDAPRKVSALPDIKAAAKEAEDARLRAVPAPRPSLEN